MKTKLKTWGKVLMFILLFVFLFSWILFYDYVSPANYRWLLLTHAIVLMLPFAYVSALLVTFFQQSENNKYFSTKQSWVGVGLLILFAIICMLQSVNSLTGAFEKPAQLTSPCYLYYNDQLRSDDYYVEIEGKSYQTSYRRWQKLGGMISLRDEERISCNGMKEITVLPRIGIILSISD